MSNEFTWHHPIDEADEWDGFNDAGIETFSGSPITHLAREIIQNSIDAGEGLPVEVHFNLASRLVTDIPDLQGLKEHIAHCLNSAKGEGKKASTFFNKAKELLDGQKIDVLEVSDFNTSGVKGPCQKGTPFFALLKAKGQSIKDSATAGGSFGIGKFAPYAVSNLRAIFVSTVYEIDGGTLDQLTQGKAILMSHDVGESRYQAAGYCGLEKLCHPVSGNPKIAPWLLRAEGADVMAHHKGTKLSILGFKASRNWQELLAISVAANFFGALLRGNLIVKIGDSITVDKATVKEFFNVDQYREVLTSSDISEDELNLRASYCAALESEGVIVEGSQMLHLGHVQLRLMVQEELPRRIAILRNGMFISDRANGMRRFSGFKDFAGVIEFLSDSGNSLMRAMEPPRHDRFEPERLESESEQKIGRKALADLASWVREMLSRHAKDEVLDVTEASELSEYFADDSSTEASREGVEVDPVGGLVISKRELKKAKHKSVRLGEQPGVSDEVGDYDGGGGDEGSGAGDGKGGPGDGDGGSSGEVAVGSELVVSRVRLMPLAGDFLRVSLTPEGTGKAALLFLAAGADKDEQLEIVSSSAGELRKSAVHVELKEGVRTTLDLKLADAYSGAIKVVAHEI